MLGMQKLKLTELLVGILKNRPEYIESEDELQTSKHECKHCVPSLKYVVNKPYLANAPKCTTENR